MSICVPIKDLRDTAAFMELVETAPGPITVTKNGYDQFVAMRSSDYDKLQQLAAENKLMERMIIAERERAEGRSVDADSAISGLREHYGLQ